MADILKPVTFSPDVAALIKKKQSDKSFTYHCWSDEDLKPLRIEVRNFYRDMQKGRCAYCRKDISLRSASNCHVEHIAPKSLHEKFIFTPENLCVICADRDEIKRAQETMCAIPDTVVARKTRRVRYPCTTNAFYIVHPHFDKYDDHILMVGKFYVDMTDKGGFTIRVCDLNKRLRKFGWEMPPSSDEDLAEVMGDFLATSDPAIRRRKIRKLREMLIFE